MAAYVIFIRERVRDQSELKIYSQKAPAPAYCEAREHHFKDADYRAVIVEGVSS